MVSEGLAGGVGGVRGTELDEEEALPLLLVLLNGRERKLGTARLPLLELAEANASLAELEAEAEAEAEVDVRTAAALLSEEPMDVMTSVECCNR